MKPDDFLAKAEHQLNAMREMKKKSVNVGVLASEATGRIYKGGSTVLQVAAAHEFGTGTIHQRSFLKMPQELKRKEISAFISKQMVKVFDGMQVEKGLGLIGVYVTNISQDAFATSGFGRWPALETDTVKAKGSSKALIDTGTLKNSVSWEIN